MLNVEVMLIRALKRRSDAKRAKEAFDIFLRPLRSWTKNPRRILAEPRTAMAALREAV